MRWRVAFVRVTQTETTSDSRSSVSRSTSSAPGPRGDALPLGRQALDRGGGEHDDRLGDAEEVLGRGAVADDDAELAGGVDVDRLGADDRAGADAQPGRGLEDLARDGAAG